MFLQKVVSLVFLTGFVFIAGCNSEESYKPIDDTKPVKGGDAPHVHKAPHGGRLIELGDHQYNLEVVAAEAKPFLTIYVLGAHAEVPVAIASQSITLHAEIHEKKQDLVFKPSPQEKDAGGSASRFVLEADSLDLHELDELAATVKLSIKGKEFSGSLLGHDDHGDHDHGDHKHGDKDHDHDKDHKHGDKDHDHDGDHKHGDHKHGDKDHDHGKKDVKKETTDKKVDSKKVDSKKVDSKKVDSKKVDSKKVDSKKVDSKKVDSKKVDSKKVDSKKVDSKKVDSKKVDSKKQIKKEVEEPKKAKEADTKKKTSLSQIFSRYVC